MLRAALWLCVVCLAAGAAQADSLRVATFNTELSRDGPGLLLRDLTRGDAQAEAAADVIAHARPDILLLQGIDWDHKGAALDAFAALIAARGLDYPHRFAPRSNRGLPTGHDLNGDGQRGDAEDSQGYGAFTGKGAMALLSRWPIDRAAARDLSDLLWADLPEADMPRTPEGGPFPSPEAAAIQRLSSGGHWVVPIRLPGGGALTVLAFHAAPPVFDGPEDRNGRRNRDEIRLWTHLLDGRLGPVPGAPFVLAGIANLDPRKGDGRHDTIRALLADQRLQDPTPENPPTVDWSARGPGLLRVSYVLPSADLDVTDAGIVWPETGPLAETVAQASRHRLVWVDVAPR
jgi:hypothetical protein